jgi:hypothetical protein
MGGGSLSITTMHHVHSNNRPPTTDCMYPNCRQIGLEQGAHFADIQKCVKGLGTSTNQLVCLLVDCIEH